MKTTQFMSGRWSKPTRKELVRYSIIVLVGVAVDYGLKGLLFQPTTHRIPLFLGINLESVFHRVSNPLAFDIIAIGLLIPWLLILPLWFRLSLHWLDKWWLEASALMFAAVLSGVLERVVTGGMHYIFSMTDGLRYLCIGRGIRFERYYWNPSDFYSSIYVYTFIIILFVYRVQLILRSSKHDPKKIAG